MSDFLSSFLLHLSSSRDAYSAHSYTSHHCLPHHYSYRWSFLFVVAYSILCQSHFSKDIERITSINLPSKIEELLAQYITCSPSSSANDRSTSNDNANQPIDQPFITTFIMAQCRCMITLPSPPLSTSTFFHFQQNAVYCLFLTSK